MSNAPAPKPIFGKIGAPFRWKHAPSATDKDRIEIQDHWADLNITSFACEELGRWTKGRSRVVTLNHKAREPFLALWKEWEKQGLLELLPASYTAPPRAVVHDGWAGGWVARYKRGVSAYDGNVSRLSNHATGMAFDIASRRYPLGASIAGPDPMHALAAVAKKFGWKWGGEFAGRKDGMHFELVQT